MMDKWLAKPTKLTWRRPGRYFLRKWLERHRQPFNFWLHLLLGIPLVAVGYVWLLFWPWADWTIGLPCFGIGFLLQFIGHLVEGNDMGELAAIKRLLGLSYVAVAPRWQSPRTIPIKEPRVPVREAV